MDLISSLLSGNQSSPSMIQEEVDPEKHAKILATLCGKRKDLEERLQDKERADTAENAILLFQLKNDMALFGISEVEYQAYLAKNTTSQELPPHSSTASDTIDSMDNTG